MCKPEICQSCAYETDRLKYYPFALRQEEGMWLCELCASTHAGNACEYPNQYPERKTLATICYVGNVILAAIRKDKTDAS